MPEEASTSKEISKDEVISYLKKRIEELEKELAIHKLILSLLTSGRGVSKVQETPFFTPDKVKVITVNDDVVANIVELDEGVRIMLRESIPVDNHLFNSFLIQYLKDKKELGDISDYDIKESRGYVTEIVIKGLERESVLKEIEIALKYLWRELHKK